MCFITKPSILLLFLLARIPVERAAMLLMDGTESVQSMSVDRKYPLRPVRMSKAMMERVYRQGTAMMSTSMICIPLPGSTGCRGVVYAATSDRKLPFDARHLELITVIADVGGLALEQAIRLERMESENSVLRRDMEMRTEIVGDSDAITKLVAQIAQVAATDSTVLIQGETGTGKELIARSVHQNSRRHAAQDEPVLKMDLQKRWIASLFLMRQN